MGWSESEWKWKEGERNERRLAVSWRERERGRKGGRREWNLVGIRKQEEEKERRTRSAAPEHRASGGACRPTHCIRSTNARCQRSSRAGRARVDDGGDIQKRDVGERKDTSLVAKLNPLIPSNVDARHMSGGQRPSELAASHFPRLSIKYASLLAPLPPPFASQPRDHRDPITRFVSMYVAVGALLSHVRHGSVTPKGL